jgi:hypothetical protein
MSTSAGSPRAGSPPPDTTMTYDTYTDTGGSTGWVVFSGVLLFLIGTINFIEGIAAVANAHFFAGHGHYVIGSLNTWGWVAIIVGVLQWLVGFGVLTRMQFARWVGVAIFGVNAVTQLLNMPSYPFWSLCIFAVDILGMYGLVAHGRRDPA